MFRSKLIMCLIGFVVLFVFSTKPVVAQMLDPMIEAMIDSFQQSQQIKKKASEVKPSPPVVVRPEVENTITPTPAPTPSAEASDSPDSNNVVTSTASVTESEEGQDLMEKALELLETADTCWVGGDIENTINALDRAYALVLDSNGDAELSRQKDDLRLLISRRILALYSAQQVRANGKGSEIPLKLNPDVEKEIRSFQGPERAFFLSSYERSFLYRELIINELRQAGVPEELFWLPLVESGFKVRALSSARALGLWQFIPSTGYAFGLTRDEWIDERMDILKSTQGAIAYLKVLHGMFGDWLTVLAAYNCGEGRVLRVISRQHINYFDRFWDLYSQLPRETARYVPRFLATLHIINDPKKYGFDLPSPTDSGLDFDFVTVNRTMRLTDIASRIDVSEEIMDILNAELRHKMTPDREYELRIPTEAKERFALVETDIPMAPRPQIEERRNFVTHRVRPGETISGIATRYRVSPSAIMKQNNIRNERSLQAGSTIRIPVGRQPAPSVRTAAAVKRYTIQPGDTLLGISRRFNIPVARIKEINNLTSNTIRVGQVLRLPRGGA